MTTIMSWYSLGWLHAALGVVAVILVYRIKQRRDQ